jgi:hypothetical protein
MEEKEVSTLLTAITQLKIFIDLLYCSVKKRNLKVVKFMATEQQA